MTLWIVNRFKKQLVECVSLFQWPLTQLAYCQSSKCPPLARLRRGEEALSINCASINCMHFVEGRAKCPTVPQRRELVTGTRVAGQGSK